MIKSRNIDPSAEFAQTFIPVPITGTASATALTAEIVAPWAGKIVSAKFRSSLLTDVDDSARVKVQKNGTDISAGVDPVAAFQTVTIPLTTTTFAAGDVLTGALTLGSGDAGVGSFYFIIRPLLGGVERVGLAG